MEERLLAALALALPFGDATTSECRGERGVHAHAPQSPGFAYGPGPGDDDDDDDDNPGGGVGGNIDPDDDEGYDDDDDDDDDEETLQVRLPPGRFPSMQVTTTRRAAPFRGSILSVRRSASF